MKFIKQIPNFITLLNLFFGCVAIVYAMQSFLQPMYDEAGNPMLDTSGVQYINVPPKIWLASLFIGLAAVADVLDGLVARLLKAISPLGIQLDSLADVVSFGVAPSVIIFQFLQLSFAQYENGLSYSILFSLPAFIFACAACYRLAKFNLDENQKYFFIGLPTPAAAILVASIPLIFWTNSNSVVLKIILNFWFWYALIFISSWLMLSKIKLLSLKFKDKTLQSFLPMLLLVGITVIVAILFGWLAVPVSFILYLLLSKIFIKNISLN